MQKTRTHSHGTGRYMFVHGLLGCSRGHQGCSVHTLERPAALCCSDRHGVRMTILACLEGVSPRVSTDAKPTRSRSATLHRKQNVPLPPPRRRSDTAHGRTLHPVLRPDLAPAETFEDLWPARVLSRAPARPTTPQKRVAGNVLMRQRPSTAPHLRGALSSKYVCDGHQCIWWQRIHACNTCGGSTCAYGSCVACTCIYAHKCSV